MTNVVTCPPIPMWHPIPNGLQLGKLIEIRGTLPYGADLFQVNFTDGIDSGNTVADRLLHISVRFSERVVVRNARLGTWGIEERNGGFPFSSGKQFIFLILVEENGYRIAVNGEHRWAFKHRSPFSNATTLNVEGSVRVEEVKFYDKFLINQNIGTCLPQPAILGETITNPTVPFILPIPGGLQPGITFYIQGRPIASPYRFTVNLQCHASPYPPPDIGLHFDVRFLNWTIVRNSRIDDQYGEEEVHVPHFAFQPGSDFVLTIQVDRDKYKVAVDGNHLVEFRHRLMPLSRINTLFVDHDVILHSVRVAAP